MNDICHNPLLFQKPVFGSDQGEGTPVDLFPLGDPGEGHYLPASEVGHVLEFEAGSLYGAFVFSENLPDRPKFPRGAYALFFSTVPGGGSNNVFVILSVDDEGHIVRLDGLVGIPPVYYFR